MSTGDEVKIVVVTDDKTSFDSIRHKAKGFGDGAGKDIEKGIGSAIKGVEKLAPDVIKAGTSLGTSLGTSVAKQATSILESTGPGGAAVGGAIIGIGAAMAPFLGALLSSAVIGGAGIGGIVGGILLVKDDPRVQNAAAEIGTSITSSLKLKAEPFVQPVLQALTTINSAFAKSGDNFSRIFNRSSQWIQPFADAFDEVFQSVTTGFADLVDNAGPVISALIDGFKEIGNTVGDSLSILSEDGAEAATALATTFEIVNAALQATVGFVDILADSFGWLAKHGLLGNGVKAEFERFQDQLDNSQKASKDTASAIGDIGDSAKDSADSIRGLSDALKAETDPTFALIDAQTQLRNATESYNKAISKYGKNSQQATDAAVNLAKANVRLAGATADAGDSTGQIPGKLLASLKASHATQSAIDAVARAFRDAARAGDDYTGVYRAQVITTYIGKPISAGNALSGGYSYRGVATGGVIGHAAEGGARTGMTLVGEQGPELVDLAPGSMVTPAGQTRSILEGNGNGGELKVTFNFAGNLDTLQATAFQKALQTGAIRIASRYITN